MRPERCRATRLRDPSRLLLLALPVTLTCSPPDPAVDGILLDGRFDEWPGAPTILEDATDAPASAIDIRSIRGLDEAPWLYLALDLGREVNVQSMPGTLRLLIDADSDLGTGGTLHSMDGVDLTVELSHAEEVDARGAGFALRAVDADGVSGPVVRYALGLTVAPSWSASRFELRMSRRGARGLAALGTDLRLKALYVEGGRVEDETPIGSYTFRTAAAESTHTSVVGRLVKAAGSLRVAQWNVASDSFFEDSEAFARILAALEPDVVLLDELPRRITPDALRAFFGLESLRGLGVWRFVLGESGGRQRTVVAARDREIRPAESMRRVRYAEGALDALGESVPAGFLRLLELEAERDVSATGAWVQVGGQEVLFVPVDLQSAGWAGSPQDRLRTLQARTIHDHIVSARRDAYGAVVIGGDLNLVGSRDPLETLIDRLDADGSDLSPVDAERIGERSYATWRNPEGLFAPGRLDFLMVPDAVATVTNSFVFGTEDVDSETLQQLGLERELSQRVSDHLVVVADVRFRWTLGPATRRRLP